MNSNSFLDELLKSKVDESEVNALVGSLESKLIGRSPRPNAATLSSGPVTTQLAQLSTIPTATKVSIPNMLASNKVQPSPSYVTTESSSLLPNTRQLIAPRSTTSTAAASPRSQSKKASTGIVNSTSTKYATIPSNPNVLKTVMPVPSTSPPGRSVLTSGARSSQLATTAITSNANRPSLPISTTSSVTANQTNPSTRYVARASMATNPRASNPSLGSQPYSSIQHVRPSSKTSMQGPSVYSPITTTRPASTVGITKFSTAEVNKVLAQLKSFLDNLIIGAPKAAQNHVKEIVQKLIVSSSFRIT